MNPGKLEYFTNLNLAASYGDDFPTNHDSSEAQKLDVNLPPEMGNFIGHHRS